MDNNEALNWLNEQWQLVLDSDFDEEDPEIDQLINSNVRSLRYALITQILGKIANEARGILFIQSGCGEDPLAWDARSFCSKVVVPWVSANHNVLGTSPDPYVNNPLRRARLDVDLDKLRYRDQWDAIIGFLEPLDRMERNGLEKIFIRCLKSLARRLAKQDLSYQIPARISHKIMLDLLTNYISSPSGGLRPLVLTASLMKVLGKAFSIFVSVESQKVNAPDSPTGKPGDVMCCDRDGNIILTIEVKDRNLTLADTYSSITKARSSKKTIHNLLFAAPNIEETEMSTFLKITEETWQSGLNINQIDIIDLTNATFILLAENWRIELLHEIGNELDQRGAHTDRQVWYDLLRELTSIEPEN